MRQVDLLVHGWGQSFRFCNSRQVLTNLDREIEEKVTRFRRANAKLAKSLPTEARSRVLGVTRLVDVPQRDVVLSPRVSVFLERSVAEQAVTEAQAGGTGGQPLHARANIQS